MGLRTDICKLAKLSRETLLREAIREFHDVTEEELISILECWTMGRDKTDEELKVYAETGCWPTKDRLNER